MEFLRVEKLTKRFGGVLALDAVDVTIGRGEIHSVVGENGAGKSTLLKILAGIVKADTGTIHFQGQGCNRSQPEQAIRTWHIRSLPGDLVVR
jgi:ribose transport system ATP-binding protein